MGSPVDKTAKSNDWFTPPRILDPVRLFFAMRPGSGVIDLDPATSESNPVGAEWAYTESDDGLVHQWCVCHPCNVFVNPPYGGGGMAAWCAKIGEEAARGARIVALLPSNRFETAYVQEHLLDSDVLAAIVFVRKRVTFLNEDGSRILQANGKGAGKPQNGNPYGSLLWIFDRDDRAGAASAAEIAFAPIGKILRVAHISGGHDWL